MSTFKKKEFEKIENINELVNSDGSSIEGDRNVTNNSEIETGPVQAPFNDDSGYEKGMSTTTDRASRYRQPKLWWNTYAGGTAYSHGVKDSLGDLYENGVKEKIKEFLNSKSNDNELINKNNSVPELEKLGNPAAINKVKEFLQVIDNNNLNGEQVAIMINSILTNIKTNTIPNNYKNILINNIKK